MGLHFGVAKGESKVRQAIDLGEPYDSSLEVGR